MISNDMQGITAFYNATAEQWAEKWYPDDTLLPLLKRFIALLGPRPRVLDAGCGAGYESMRMKALGADVLGADVSDVSIGIARKRNPDIGFVVMDMLCPDFSIGRFDGIAAIALLVHVNGANLRLAFDNFRKLIAPSGFLFVAFVEGDGFCSQRSHAEIEGVKYNRAFYLHKPTAMIDTAAESGFSFYEEVFLPGLAGGWKYHIYKVI